jgi:hypothetical protein
LKPIDGLREKKFGVLRLAARKAGETPALPGAPPEYTRGKKKQPFGV